MAESAEETQSLLTPDEQKIADRCAEALGTYPTAQTDIRKLLATIVDLRRQLAERQQ